MKILFYIYLILILPQISFEIDNLYSVKNKNFDSVYHILQTNDFEISGDGDSENWDNVQWLDLVPLIPFRNDDVLFTRVKALYSQTGIYFLFYCQDSKLTATMEVDFMDLWKEDVVEVFLWPDQAIPTYFEYELSPLNYELAILVSNIDGELYRWQPFHYETDRQARHATSIIGGEKKIKVTVSAWKAEFFIPYKLLRPLKNISPQKGTTWRANFYRIDHDDGVVRWSWQPIDRSYHEIEKFGEIIFQ